MTEALAATLEAAPAAAAALVNSWFNIEVASDSELTVRTQRWTTQGDRVDLELLFGTPRRPMLRVWVEAKVDAVPDRSQIERYLDALPPRPIDRRVCWLLPVGVSVRGGSLPAAPVHTWADLATVLFRWCRTQTDGTYAGSLVSEFVRHLEENKLASIQPLDPGDASAMSRYRLTLARVAELVRLAGEHIASSRGEALERGSWPTKADFWQILPRGAAWPEDARFDWYGRIDEAREEPQGDWVIGAGASWRPADEPDEALHRGWYARARALGFELGSGPHATYLYRYLRLHDLVDAGALSDQAHRLADWALETWRLLDDLPPTADALRINPDHHVMDVVDEHGNPLPLGRLLEEEDFPDVTPPGDEPADSR